MLDVSKEQRQLLKTLTTVESLAFSDIPTKDLYHYDYLASLDCVKWNEISYGVNYTGIKREPQKISVSITPRGLAYLDSKAEDDFRFKLPLIISAIALVIAILAIVLSPFFNALFTKLYGL